MTAIAWAIVLTAVLRYDAEHTKMGKPVKAAFAFYVVLAVLLITTCIELRVVL